MFLLHVDRSRFYQYSVRSACALGFAVGVWSGSSYASGLPVTLSYDAPWECPNRQQFWEQLHARSKRLTERKQVVVGVTIEARITGSNYLYHGHLRLIDTNNPVVERDVGGSSCVDVSAALALITAVTLDAARSRPKPDASVPARPEKIPMRWAVGLLSGIDKVVAPSAVPTFGLSFTYHDRARMGSPEFRIAGLFALSRWEPVSTGGQLVGDARFSWFASRSAACPFQLQLASTTIGPCAALELGVLKGEGRIRDAVQTKTGLWVAPGALLNWSVQADPVWLRLAAGAVVPLIRDRFQFNPKPHVFQPPGVGLSAEVELAWAFQ